MSKSSMVVYNSKSSVIIHVEHGSGIYIPKL